ncbi:MAG: hypothetical protein JWM96_837 [Alphaproteobacteria bacterium]|nr:hypothetical protein [Alphaproteobacteria bacterium]
MKASSMVLAAAIGLGVSACATQQPHCPHAMGPDRGHHGQHHEMGHNGMKQYDMLRAMDKNGDGAVSRTEARAFEESHFAMMDKNKDGKLSGDELHRMRRPGGPRHGPVHGHK